MKKFLVFLLAVSFVFTGAACSKEKAPDKYSSYQEAIDKKDYEAAFRMARPLAEKGDAGAQYNLGLMYYTGEGVPQDYAEAVKWYTKAAEQGYADAQNNLGAMYVNGQGVPQNYAQALKWITKAAEQGVAGAQSNLGLMYYNGQGVPQNFVQGYMWWSLAAAQGNENAQKGRDTVAARMTPAQIAEGQKLAAEWQKKHNQK